jgi:flagellar motor switch protein FliM
LDRILTKEEIGELLSAVKHGTIETGSEIPAPVPEQGVRALELVGGRGLSRWKIPNLDLIFDSIGRSYGITLTNRLQRQVTVKYTGSDSMGFEAFLEAVPHNGAIGLLDLEPFKSGALLLFDGELSVLLLEVVLGGTVKKIVPVKRPLTTIETNLIKGLMDPICPDLKKSFQPVETLRPELLKVETNPRLVNIVPPEAGILVVTFSIGMDKLSGVMTLVIPHASLEPLREKLRESTLSVDLRNSEEWPALLGEGVASMPVEMSVQAGQVVVTVRDILNFQEGDIIDLGCAPNAPLKVLIEGKPKYWASAGTANGNKAIRIINRMERS